MVVCSPESGAGEPETPSLVGRRTSRKRRSRTCQAWVGGRGEQVQCGYGWEEVWGGAGGAGAVWVWVGEVWGGGDVGGGGGSRCSVGMGGRMPGNSSRRHDKWL